MDENIEEETEEPATADAGERSEPETDEEIKKLDAENERLEKAIKKKEELKAKNRELREKAALGGDSEAGIPPEKPKKLTDTEYAEALQRGEVNPLKEDGLI